MRNMGMSDMSMEASDELGGTYPTLPNRIRHRADSDEVLCRSRVLKWLAVVKHLQCKMQKG